MKEEEYYIGLLSFRKPDPTKSFLVEKRQERNTKVRVWSRGSRCESCACGMLVGRGVEKGDWGEVWKSVFGELFVYAGGRGICGEIVGGFTEREEKIERRK